MDRIFINLVEHEEPYAQKILQRLNFIPKNDKEFKRWKEMVATGNYNGFKL
jgi:hypothetical protein